MGEYLSIAVMRIIGIKEADKIHSYPLLFYIQDAQKSLDKKKTKKHITRTILKIVEV